MIHQLTPLTIRRSGFEIINATATGELIAFISWCGSAMNLYGPPLWALFEARQKKIADGFPPPCIKRGEQRSRAGSSTKRPNIKRSQDAKRLENLLSRPQSVVQIVDEETATWFIPNAKKLIAQG